MEPIIIPAMMVEDNDCKVTIFNEHKERLIAIFSSDKLEVEDVLLSIKTLKEASTEKVEAVAQMLLGRRLLEKVESLPKAVKLELWPLVAAAQEATEQTDKKVEDYDQKIMAFLPTSTGGYETSLRDAASYLTRQNEDYANLMVLFLDAYVALLMLHINLSAKQVENKLVAKFNSTVQQDSTQEAAFKAVGRLLLGI